MEVSEKKVLNFVRVPYAKSDTPDELKEYLIIDYPNSPVGTRREIFQWYDSNHLVDKGYILGRFFERGEIEAQSIS